MRKLHSTSQVTEMFNAHLLWEQGITGKGMKVAVFDTGLGSNHPHFRNVAEITNWTDEETSDDHIGHGTFVAGIISSQLECYGFAPDSELYIFRIFTTNRASYTSWFLDAFNYAIHTQVNILNLSIGGPDFMDKPFVEKVWELSANNIVVISAIGNDGPLFGTLNNPADQPDVIGVGGIDFKDQIASFSSRGMTTWELPNGYGRVKPDIVAYGQNVEGTKNNGGCRSLSGTSVASPVVAGAVALLASSVPESQRWNIINPASMKQILVETADRLPDFHIYEQGAGKLNILNAYHQLSKYTPRASCFPSTLDLTNCPYMWPYCNQPIYFTAIPTILNVTLLNGMGVFGEIRTPPLWKPGSNGNFLEISFSYSEILWPWTGHLGIYLRVHEDGKNFEGVAEGIISFVVHSPPQLGEIEERKTEIDLPLRVSIIPTPSRSKRILWDQFHNLRYPSGYFPRDSLSRMDEPFDWNGDHVHTNFRGLYQYLRKLGYFVEVLGYPFNCFNSSHYSVLMIVDTEDYFFEKEIQKITEDVKENNLSLLVFADWYDAKVMKKLNFFDDNTKRWWTPATGGANVPQLNKLLSQFDIQFGNGVFLADYRIQKQPGSFSSGVPIAKFPAGGSLLSISMMDKTIALLEERVVNKDVAMLGLYPTNNASRDMGRIAVFGDSGCIDDSTTDNSCFWLLADIMKFISQGEVSDLLQSEMKFLEEDFVSDDFFSPEPFEGNEFFKHSKVFGRAISCQGVEFQRDPKPQKIEIDWKNSTSFLDWDSSGKFRTQVNIKPKQNSFSGGRIYEPYVWYLCGMGFIFAVVALFLRGKRTNRNQEIPNL